MIRLYGGKGGGNMAAHAALEEVGAEYELVMLDLSKGEQRSPDYLRLNPNGRVPTLVDGEAVVFESAACLMYVADRHPGSGLAPPADSPARGRYYTLMVWMTNTLQESGNGWAHPESWAADPALHEAVKGRAVERLARHWDMAEAALADSPFLLGEAPTAPDLFLFTLAYWSRRYPVRAVDRPRLRAHATAMRERPAVRRMMEQEGLEWSPGEG